MNLLVDLYDNVKNINLRINNLRNRKYSLKDSLDLSSFLSEVNSNCNSDFEFISSIRSGVSSSRRSFDLLGSIMDTHFNLESLNVASYSRDYLVVLSVQDLLPMLLHLQCGCSIDNVNKIPDINDISRNILEMRFRPGLSLRSFLGVDDKLDNYIRELNNIAKNDEVTLLKLFVTDLYTKMTGILKHIAIYFEANTHLVPISIDKSKVLFTSMIPKAFDEPNGELICKLGEVNFKLNPLITNERFGYFNSINSFRFGEMI